MPTFAYTARDAAAQTRRGKEDAASAAALIGSLRSRGWLVTNVQPFRSERSYNPFNLLPPRSVHVELSFRQIAMMIRSGLTLLTALRTAAEQAPKGSMRRIWTDVADTIQRGSTLADAMAKYRCFPPMAIQLIRVGEQTGMLEPVLTRAAEALERRRLLKTNLITALAYPAVVTVAAIGVAAFMVLYIIPILADALKKVGRKLPPMTQWLIDISDFVTTNGVLIAAVLFLLTVGIISLYLSPRGRLMIDRLLLRVPLLGTMFRLSATAQFAYSLGTLLRSGVTLVEALATVANLHSNRYAAGAVVMARQAVIRGGALADQLAASRAYMPVLPRMVAVGESAGTLDEVLEDVAKYHESQLQILIRRLSVLLEPAVVVVVGGIVGFVYIAFFKALFSVYQGAK